MFEESIKYITDKFLTVWGQERLVGATDLEGSQPVTRAAGELRGASSSTGTGPGAGGRGGWGVQKSTNRVLVNLGG